MINTDYLEEHVRPVDHPAKMEQGEDEDYVDYASLYEAHSGCAHSHHHAWRRWKIARRTINLLYRMNLSRGYCTSYNAHCKGCISSIVWGRRRNG